MKSIDTHLGRTAEGKRRPEYVTPSEVTPELLVPVPRELNRTAYGIKPDMFIGFDRWTCYEFSALCEDGFPLNGRLDIVYDCSSEVIVESKSLKLYLNSFNLHRLRAHTPDEFREEVLKTVGADLARLGIKPHLQLTLDIDDTPPSRPITRRTYVRLESILSDQPVRLLNRPAVGPQPLIEISGDEADDVIRLTAAIRSNCKVTHQPDWGRVIIAYVPGRYKIAPEALMSLIVSLREENHFHEEICEMLFADLNARLAPQQLLVACNYLRRGGIDINPVRASDRDLLRSEIWSPYVCRTKPDPNQ